MATKEITADWEKLTDAIIDAILEALREGIREGIKEVVKEGLADVAKNAAGGVLQGAIWTTLTPVAIPLILAVQQQHTKLLKSIQHDVKALVNGPYNAGIIHLEDALKEQRTAGERLLLITKAREKFVEACANQQDLDSFCRAITQREIGVCWLLGGSLRDAKDWFEHSLASANQALIERKASFDRKTTLIDTTLKVGGVAIGLIGVFTGGMGFLVGVPAGAGAAELIGDLRQEEFKETEQIINSFIASISRVLNRINSDTCPRCRKPIPRPNARYCASCGRKLS